MLYLTYVDCFFLGFGIDSICVGFQNWALRSSRFWHVVAKEALNFQVLPNYHQRKHLFQSLRQRPFLR